VNEKVDFDLASLLKVPVVMAYYLNLEKDGLEIKQEVTIQSSQIDMEFGDLWKRGVGAKVTLDEAARLAITESDNTATKVLADSTPRNIYEEIYNNLDIDLPLDDASPKLSTKSYSSILKALYFAALINKDHSQKVIQMLIGSRFKDKLPAGVPENIEVANKVGVRAGEIYQDCGIVYLPERPYILCMISQSDEKEATTRMVAVSKAVYEYVSKANE
jgi:beta-lactamase class A